MTVYYVASDRPDDTGDGLSVATAKKFLNSIEDKPVVPGDLCHVKAGTYRETHTVDVSGTAGNPIEFRGDYAGVIFGTGGLVRVTGSDNDQTATRANCITATSKNYRTFTGLLFDTTTGALVSLATACGNWIVQRCLFDSLAANNFQLTSAGTGTANTILNCVFMPARSSAINFTHSSTVDNAGHVIDNCIVVGSGAGIGVATTRVGGITVRNNLLMSCSAAVRVITALTVGQTVIVNNCVVLSNIVGMQGTVTGEIIEDYNTLHANTTARTNTATGANSNTYPPLFDTRWFFQLVTAGAGPNNPFQVVSPFDLASYSQLVNLAGTSPPATDMRGTGTIGAQREWGALETDSTLRIVGDRARARFLMGM